MRTSFAVALASSLALAAGVSGCGSSASATEAAATAPTASAQVIYRRAEHALARARSFTMRDLVVVRHRPDLTSSSQVAGHGRLQTTVRVGDLSSTDRIIGRAAYVVIRRLEFNGAWETLGDGRWTKLPAVGSLLDLVRVDSPHRLVGCMFPTLRPHEIRLGGTGTLDGVATDVLRVREGDGLGLLRITVSADPPYLPLTMVRSGMTLSAAPSAREIRADSGCPIVSEHLESTLQRERAAAHLHLRSARLGFARVSFGGYDASEHVPKPHDVRVVALTPALRALFGSP